MIGHGEKLSRKQEAAIAALLSESTVAQAAGKAGVGEVTLWRWLKEPGFKAAYREARQQVVDTAIGRIQEVCSEAVETLRAVMQDAQAPASSRVAAAKSILEMAMKAVETQDLEERIAVLEEVTRENRRFVA